MVKTLQGLHAQQPSPGRPAALAVEEEILVTLEYWRESRTYFHISTDWGVSESTGCRIVHRVDRAL